VLALLIDQQLLLVSQHQLVIVTQVIAETIVSIPAQGLAAKHLNDALLICKLFARWRQ